MNTCSLCENPPVYKRAYSGEHLCKECFSKSIFEKTKRTISKYRMLRHGEVIAVAVSGGKDSLSLLHIMSKMASDHASEIYAVTIDEGISGYRQESLAIVKEFTKRLGVSHTVVSFKELYDLGLDEALALRGERTLSSCAICGTLRRRAIDIAARKVNADVVATAHNLDDMLQTFYINMLNGDLERIRQLHPEARSQSPFNIRRIKPFMEIYEQEIAFYAYLNNIPFQTISCPYMDEGIRSEIRVIINRLEEEHPGTKYSTLAAVMAISKSIEQKADRVIRNCSICGFPTSDTICSVCNTIRFLQRNR